MIRLGRVLVFAKASPCSTKPPVLKTTQCSIIGCDHSCVSFMLAERNSKKLNPVPTPDPPSFSLSVFRVEHVKDVICFITFPAPSMPCFTNAWKSCAFKKHGGLLWFSKFQFTILVCLKKEAFKSQQTGQHIIYV